MEARRPWGCKGKAEWLERTLKVQEERDDNWSPQ